MHLNCFLLFCSIPMHEQSLFNHLPSHSLPHIHRDAHKLLSVITKTTTWIMHICLYPLCLRCKSLAPSPAHRTGLKTATSTATTTMTTSSAVTAATSNTASITPSRIPIRTNMNSKISRPVHTETTATTLLSSPSAAITTANISNNINKSNATPSPYELQAIQ